MISGGIEVNQIRLILGVNFGDDPLVIKIWQRKEAVVIQKETIW